MAHPGVSETYKSELPIHFAAQDPRRGGGGGKLGGRHPSALSLARKSQFSGKRPRVSESNLFKTPRLSLGPVSKGFVS